MQPDPCRHRGTSRSRARRSRVHRPLAARRPHSSRACTTTATRPARALDLSAVRREAGPGNEAPVCSARQTTTTSRSTPSTTSRTSRPGISTLCAAYRRLQKRFLRGEFADATPNALFADETIDKWRVIDGKVPDFVRVVVAVDPSGSGDADNADNDAIGIVVAALGTDGNAYLLEDCTVKAGPETWGKVATSAYERHDADVIVGEANYGGDMVRMVVHAAGRARRSRR